MDWLRTLYASIFTVIYAIMFRHRPDRVGMHC